MCIRDRVLADLQTIREYKGSLEGLKLCYIGAGNNMANSYINGCILAGMQVALACPKEYLPDTQICAKAATTGRFTPVSYTHLDVYKRQVGNWAF